MLKKSLIALALALSTSAVAMPHEWLTCARPDNLIKLTLDIDSAGELPSSAILATLSNASGIGSSQTTQHWGSVLKPALDGFMRTQSRSMEVVLQDSLDSIDVLGTVSNASLLSLRKENRKITALLATAGIVISLECKGIVH